MLKTIVPANMGIEIRKSNIPFGNLGNFASFIDPHQHTSVLKPPNGLHLRSAL
jgi:hypothetical protein